MTKIDMAYLEEMQKWSLVDIIREMKTIENELEAQKQIVTHIQSTYDHIRKNIIPQRMELEGIPSIVVNDVGRVTVRPMVQASIRADHKNEAYQWLEDYGHDIMTQTVNSSTLTALVKRLIEKGEEVPAELFNIYTYELAVITKS